MRSALSLSLVVVTLPGCFLLDRLEGIEPGTITGVAVDSDAAALADARAELGPRLAPAGDDGAFRISGLPIGAQVLRVSEDVGDDGVVDRVAFRAFAISNVGGDGKTVASSVLLGDVTLLGTAVVNAHVVTDAAGGAPFQNARVVAYKAADELSGAELVDGGGGAADFDHEVLEGSASALTGADGNFSIAGVPTGDVHFFVVGDVDGVAYGVETRQRITDLTQTIAGDLVALPLPLEPQSVQVRFVVDGGEDEQVQVEVRRSATGDLVRAQAASVGAETTLQLPIDLYDVVVTDGDDGEIRRGFLRSISSASPDNDGVVVWRILLEKKGVDACAATNAQRNAAFCDGVAEGEGEGEGGEGEGEGEGEAPLCDIAVDGLCYRVTAATVTGDALAATCDAEFGAAPATPRTGEEIVALRRVVADAPVVFGGRRDAGTAQVRDEDGALLAYEAPFSPLAGLDAGTCVVQHGGLFDDADCGALAGRGLCKLAGVVAPGARCGNGVKEGDEECDGGGVDGAGCNADCTLACGGIAAADVAGVHAAVVVDGRCVGVSLLPQRSDDAACATLAPATDAELAALRDLHGTVIAQQIDPAIEGPLVGVTGRPGDWRDENGVRVSLLPFAPDASGDGGCVVDGVFGYVDVDCGGFVGAAYCVVGSALDPPWVSEIASDNRPFSGIVRSTSAGHAVVFGVVPNFGRIEIGVDVTCGLTQSDDLAAAAAFFGELDEDGDCVSAHTATLRSFGDGKAGSSHQVHDIVVASDDALWIVGESFGATDLELPGSTVTVDDGLGPFGRLFIVRIAPDYADATVFLNPTQTQLNDAAHLDVDAEGDDAAIAFTYGQVGTTIGAVTLPAPTPGPFIPSDFGVATFHFDGDAIAVVNAAGAGSTTGGQGFQPQLRVRDVAIAADHVVFGGNVDEAVSGVFGGVFDAGANGAGYVVSLSRSLVGEWGAAVGNDSDGASRLSLDVSGVTVVGDEVVVVARNASIAGFQSFFDADTDFATRTSDAVPDFTLEVPSASVVVGVYEAASGNVKGGVTLEPQEPRVDFAFTNVVLGDVVGDTLLIGGAQTVGLKAGSTAGLVLHTEQDAEIERERDGAGGAWALGLRRVADGFDIVRRVETRSLGDFDSSIVASSVVDDGHGGVVIAGAVFGNHVFGDVYLQATGSNDGSGGQGYLWHVPRDGVVDPAPGACLDLDDCGAGSVCDPLTRTCQAACDDDTDCDAGESCHRPTGLCGAVCDTEVPACSDGFVCAEAGRLGVDTCIPSCTGFVPGALCDDVSACCGDDGLCFRATGRFDATRTYALDVDVGSFNSQVLFDPDNFAPAPRSGAGFVDIGGGRALLVYGVDENGAPAGDFWVFDANTNDWNPISLTAGIPAACDLVDGFSAVPVFNGTGVVGGTLRDGSPNTSLCTFVDGGGNDFTLTATPLTGPTFRDAAATSNRGNEIFVFGGVGNDALLRLNPQTETAWTTVTTTNAPLGVQGASLVQDPDTNELVLFGGTFANGVVSDLVTRFDINTNVWTTVTALPEPRTHMAAVVVRDDPARFFLIGGSDGNDALRDSVVYVRGGDAVTAPDGGFGLRRVDAAAVALGSLIVTFGGNDVVAEGVCPVTDPFFNP